MGFSVSGSAAIIFAGLFIAFGLWYSASVNSFEQVEDAQQERANAAVEKKNIDIELQSATFDTAANEITIKATNNGTIALWLEKTDLLINNTHQENWQSSASVFTGATTESGISLWQPGEELVVTVTWDETTDGTPNRVKLVTEYGISDGKGVTST